MLAAVLRCANLAALGYANHYYSAAVASMLQSWHNFFFVAAEPGGSVSVDKPPLGLWLQAISAYFFGLNGFAVLLPQIIAGILSVIVVYYLVRRSFGIMAGLLAALVLAITPVVVAIDRNNTMDSTLILTLLLAAWAFIKATEKGKLRYLLLGTALVGVGFNIKMLEAFLPLPAFYALYLLGSSQRLWRKLANLGLAILLLVIVSFSWAVSVDLTPAELRPYVGSSGDNSVLDLAIGYNGVERLLGMGGRRPGNRPGGGPAGPPAGVQPQPGVSGSFSMPGSGANGPRWQDLGYGALQSPGNYTFGPRGQPQANRIFPPSGPNSALKSRGQGAPGGFGGGMDTGQPGVLRLFTAPLNKEMSWLLPLGLFSLILLACLTRLRWPIAAEHQAWVLWGGWLLTGAVFFSVAGFFHPYYLAIIAPPLAALVGIGAAELWRLNRQRPWLAVALLLIAAAATLGLQIITARAFAKAVWWLPVAIGLFVIGAGVLILVTSRKLPRGAVAGFSCVIAATLLTPGIWSALTALNSSENQSLPSAYAGRSSGPTNRGGLQVSQALLDYLEAHTQDMTYLMAVPSSMQGADYVLATGRPVLYLGGFMGQDKVVSSDDLKRMVAGGELRYIYWNSPGGGFGGQADVSTWVTTQCKAVTGFEASTRNTGAPGGILTGQDEASVHGRLPGSGLFPGGRDMQVSLYDCGG